MFKSVTSKIFFAFALLVIFEGITLSFLFARLITQETETFVLDSLSLRSQLKASELQKALNIKENISKILSEHPDLYILSNSNINSHLPENFKAEELLSIAPSSGSSVTTCEDIQKNSYFCALTALPNGSLWIFERIPQGSIFQIFEKLKFQIAGFALVWLILCLAMTYLLSQLLLHPLRQFAKTSEKVAKGNFDIQGLPVNRNDEIGDFAKTLARMIHQLMQREFHLSQSTQKLVHAARLASIGQMGASIAHEVKNPLTSMMGYAKVLLKKSSDPETLEAAEIIYKESERCNQILSQMLRFSRTESDEKKPFNLQEVIDSTLLLVKAEAKNKRVTINSQTKTTAVVRGQAQQIQQVILNLLMNALQTSSENSSIEIKSKEENSMSITEVTDHGKGIPDSIKPRIFDPFFTTKDKREGTGLGLSVAQDIINHHGGEITFETQEGSGTTFRFTLPLS